VAHLTTYLDLESLKIQRSGFDFKSNLSSAIGDLANRDIQQDMFPAIMPWPMTAHHAESISVSAPFGCAIMLTVAATKKTTIGNTDDH
jgi:hypothetical protein